MTENEMKNLKIGDVIRHKSDVSKAYVVTDNFGSRITAVRTVDVTNPDEWVVVTLQR